MVNGSTIPSRFLSELPSDNIISNSDTNANYFGNLDYQNNILENNNTYMYKITISKGDRVFHQNLAMG